MAKIIVILGPTGVGKTRLSVEIAKVFHGEIINGDAMQVYKGMNIGTAKIKEEEKQYIPHHMFDILEVGEDNSSSDNQARMRATIENIISHKKLPIIVGGTGMYLKSALFDYDFNDIPQRNTNTEEKYVQYNNQELYQILTKIDSVSATKIHYNNRRRVLRAIEIYENTGISKSEQEAKQNHVCLYDALFIGLNLKRELLHQIIDQRVDKMFDEGLVEEVKKLLANPHFILSTSAQAIGYKELIPYFAGHYSLDDAKAQIKIHTHQYAKRQSTWFTNQLPVQWIDVDISDFANTINEAKKKIQEFL